VWGKHKPAMMLYNVWAVLQYFFFGTVGAQLNFEMRTGSIMGNSFIIVICALIFICMAVFLVAIDKKYTNKERLYMAFSWIPKAAVQATLSGAFAI
jgi:NhaP-type Na+/H+ or K+/H+ antiporter